jgi:glycosyltransferase involved in cell wall biosynthesis
MKISVVIPLYNKGPYIEACLRSVCAQRRPADEIIVVDDGSTDNGAAIVSALGIANLRLIRQANGGVSAARNAGIDAARGDIVCFLDADDCYLPEFLASIAALAGDYPEAAVLATAYLLRRPDGTQDRNRLHHSLHGRGLVGDYYAAWNRSCFFFTSSVAIRRSVLMDNRFRFPAGERLAEDQDLWFRLAEHFPVAFEPVPLAEYRTGVPGSATSASAVGDELPAFRRLYERLRTGQVPRHLRRSAARLYASHLLNVANVRRARGDHRGAITMVLRKPAVANPGYWLRTFARALWPVASERTGGNRAGA